MAKDLKTLCSESICDGSGLVEACLMIETRLPAKGAFTYTCPCITKAQARAKYHILTAASNLHMYKGQTLQAFRPETPDQKDALRLVSQGRDGFYIWGPPGVGKTHLAAGTVFREIQKGRPAAIISMPDLAQRFRESKTRTELEELAYTIPYLVLDDVDKVNFTPMIEEMLFRLIDARWLLYRRGRGHTSFTSQIPRDEKHDPDNWLGSRLNFAIQDRIRGLTLNIFLDGESRRGPR